MLSPTPEVLIQLIWGGAQEVTVLTSFLIVPMLLVWEPHVVNRYSSPQISLTHKMSREFTGEVDSTAEIK